MDIIISQRLKELRNVKGNTQEDLAEFLSISIPAVSKWERAEGMPDITLLPKIAAYYNVTVDDLLGVGEMRKQERIEWYNAESQKLQNVGKIPEAVELWREAIKEFPNDLGVISNLAHAVFYQNPMIDEHFIECIELQKRVLKESTDQNLRDIAIQELSFSYDRLGDTEKAKEYANMGSNLWCSKDIILSSVLNGDESVKYNQHLICDFVDLIGISLDDISSVDWLIRHEFYLKLLNLVFDDGFMGFYACRAAERHHYCAKIYAGWENAEDKVRYHLEQLVKFAKQYDGLNGEYTYTCTLLKGMTGNSNSSTINVEGTYCEKYLNDLIGSDSWMFDKYRETDWFKAVISELSQN